ncbi:response regulator receiver protein [Stanieria cyanosphaera PCC 7437]|uniref:Response regulator receiver protein n=1 Tax=Stanieria cyanosphaera (strain ATCC 29371 / PCC 7437) TaxID=111780 RepID=K9XSL9_STAC7|nr:response regulator [Stanieria cyanosphaera]AFZ35538.1 response regulator receiver protein [Stanieria cyanosphaera PCC 7437]
MLNHPCRVLLVEDEPEDLEKLKTILTNARSASFRRGFNLTRAETLAEGKQLIAQAEFEVVILDLMLPDSRGLNTLREMQSLNSKVPIIVLTSIEDEIVAVKVLELGACGYLPKNVLAQNLLIYAIRTAIERKLQLAKFEEWQKQQPAQEIALLENFLNEQLLSSESLHKKMPDIVAEIKEHYHDLLDRFVEQKLYQVQYQIACQIDVLVEQLGYLQATPRDLVEVHSAILKQKQATLGHRQAMTYTIEGRYLLLEMMGKLAAYYRKYYIGLNKINLAQNYNNEVSRSNQISNT